MHTVLQAVPSYDILAFGRVENKLYEIKSNEEVCQEDSFTEKELIEIILDEDWCDKNMAGRVVSSWLEFERS